MTTTKLVGQLEIDHERGVIYFHSEKDGYTILRMCGINKPIVLPVKGQIYQLDITIEKATVMAEAGI